MIEVRAREVEEFAHLKGAKKTEYYKKHKKVIQGQAQHEIDTAKRRRK